MDQGAPVALKEPQGSSEQTKVAALAEEALAEEALAEAALAAA